MRIATAQWSIRRPSSFAAWHERLRAELGGAAAQGAELALLLEYLALELAGLFAAATQKDFLAALDALQALYADWQASFSNLARETGLHVLAGTFLLRQPSGRYRNRAELYAPDGGRWFQDKLVLTGFERSFAAIEPGDQLRVFDTALGRIGVNVCYDSEFPLFARRQYEAGARLLLVPSCTDTPAGATRVRVGCRARALENQIHVAQSVTAGEAAWNPALDTNTGIAAVFAPSDRGLPDSGEVARAVADETWAIADIDGAALDAVRRNGQVANAADWEAQLRPHLLAAVVR